jgi:hypothetical protein
MNLQTHFQACFVINLKRRLDRLAEFWEEVYRNFGVPGDFIHRWEAFDHPSCGNSGCTRSHRELIKTIANGPYERVLVLEDDVSLITEKLLLDSGFTYPDCKVMDIFKSIEGTTLNERFFNLCPHIPDDYDVLYLGGGYGEPPIERVNGRLLRVGFMQTTSSYGITRDFARKFTEMVGPDLDKHPGAIDNLFGSFAKEHRYYCLSPRLLYQRKSYSDLNGGTNSYLCSMTDPTHEIQM